MAHFPACALIAAVFALSAADLRAGIIRVADTDPRGLSMPEASAAKPGNRVGLPASPKFDQLLAADAAAAGGAGNSAGGNAAVTPVPEVGTAALMAAALGAWLMLHAIIQRSLAARRARARGRAARTWSESRW